MRFGSFKGSAEAQLYCFQYVDFRFPKNRGTGQALISVAVARGESGNHAGDGRLAVFGVPARLRSRLGNCATVSEPRPSGSVSAQTPPAL